MNVIRAYVMWRLKEGVNIPKEDLTYFSPGGYRFTHATGKNISFDFTESYGDYIEADRLLDFNHNNIDTKYISYKLIDDKNYDLVKDEYRIDFFKDGNIELDNKENEIYCFMDLKGIEVDYSKYIEPVYLELYEGENRVILLNKLTTEEYKKYFE